MTASGNVGVSEAKIDSVKKRIVLVEDERLIARDLQGKLIKLGYEVAGLACSKAEALELVDSTRPDLVLMDIHLRGPLDGIEAAGEIRSRYGIPLVYLTGHSDRETIGKAQVTEPFGYLLKPVDFGELHAVLESALERSRLEKAARGDGL